MKQDTGKEADYLTHECLNEAIETVKKHNPLTVPCEKFRIGAIYLKLIYWDSNFRRFVLREL